MDPNDDGELARAWSRPEVPNLSLTMYPFSIPTYKHLPLQPFYRWTCTPKISYDKTFYHDYS